MILPIGCSTCCARRNGTDGVREDLRANVVEGRGVVDAVLVSAGT
jgi:hypothetical protein